MGHETIMQQRRRSGKTAGQWAREKERRRHNLGDCVLGCRLCEQESADTGTDRPEITAENGEGSNQ